MLLVVFKIAGINTELVNLINNEEFLNITMKETKTIPIEVFAVEDKVFAKLSFKQLVITFAAIFINLMILIAPPKWSINFTKIFLILMISLISYSLILRIKNKPAYSWLKLIIIYHRRPKVYIKPSPKLLKISISNQSISPAKQLTVRMLSKENKGA